MNIIFGIKTYNRLEYLKQIVASWNATRSNAYNWTLIIADDGSDDGSVQFIKSLKFNGAEIIRSFNKRRGVHHLANQILKESSKRKFDIGFMAEDDCYFTIPGWDKQYIQAIKLTSFDHLCYFNLEWCRKFRKHTYYRDCKKPVTNRFKKIQSYLKDASNAFGIFWTFTPEVIKKVGYFDLQNMGLCGGGHTDYTLRCCRAGFNERKCLYDIFNSGKYIRMKQTDYIHSITFKKRAFAAFFHKSLQHKNRTKSDEKRIYVGYNELMYDMNGEEICT